jgi:hypothetical protein
MCFRALRGKVSVPGRLKDGVISLVCSDTNKKAAGEGGRVSQGTQISDPTGADRPPLPTKGLHSEAILAPPLVGNNTVSQSHPESYNTNTGDRT